MAEHRYEMVIQLDAGDDIEGGTMVCLLGIVGQALADADLRPHSLQICEVPSDY